MSKKRSVLDFFFALIIASSLIIFILTMLIAIPVRLYGYADVYKYYTSISYQYQMVPYILTAKMDCDLYFFEILIMRYNLMPYENPVDLSDFYYDNIFGKTFSNCVMSSRKYYSEDTFPLYLIFYEKDSKEFIIKPPYIKKSVKVLYGLDNPGTFFPVIIPNDDEYLEFIGTIAVSNDISNN